MLTEQAVGQVYPINHKNWTHYWTLKLDTQNILVYLKNIEYIEIIDNLIKLFFKGNLMNTLTSKIIFSEFYNFDFLFFENSVAPKELSKSDFLSSVVIVQLGHWYFWWSVN
jgi:phenylalanyl-tRNA synthetase alpha subunit